MNNIYNNLNMGNSSIAIGYSAGSVVNGTNNTIIGSGYSGIGYGRCSPSSFHRTAKTMDNKSVLIFCDANYFTSNSSTSYIVENTGQTEGILFNGVCDYPWTESPPGHFLNGKLVKKEVYKNALIGARFEQNKK